MANEFVIKNGAIIKPGGTLTIGDPATTGYSLPATDGDSGQLLTTDGNGNVTFQSLDADLLSIAATTATGVLKRTSGTTWATGATLNDLAAPTASFSMNSQKITSLALPDDDADAATKGYVDGSSGAGLIRSDGTVAFAADQSMGGHKLTGLGTPTLANDAVSKTYIETNFQPLDADLTSIAATTVVGVLKRTAGTTWATGATLNDVAAPTVDFSMNSKKITDLASGSNPNDAVNYGYVNSTFQPLDGDLTAISAIAGTSGVLKKTAANTWSLDTASYQPLDADLTAIGAVAGTGFLKKTGLNTWSLDTSTYQTTSTRLTNLIAQSGTSGFLTKTGADTWSLDTSTYLQPTPTTNSGSLSMTGAISAGSTITGTSSITVANNASSSVHYWYQIDGTTRGVSYINASTGDMIIHPYNSGGTALAGSQLTLRAANDGVEIGASVHHSNGDIQGSVYGNTWLTTWVNGRAEYYAAAAAAGKITRDFITVAGWWAGNSLYAYMGDGSTYRSIITSDAGLPNNNSVTNINHGWDQTHGSFQWTTLWSGYGYGIYPWVSGRALKEDIKPTEVKAIDKIKAIPLKSFKFKKPKDKDGVESKQFKNIVQQAVPVGVVAEDLETIIPEAVMTRDGQKNINPNAVISYLLKAVQELTARVEELEKRGK